MPRNPKWELDELILALELYSRVRPQHTGPTNPEIIALSERLNSLPIHVDESRQERFRNPAGVYMKLCNFLRLDPDYEGVGLQDGSRAEEVIWDQYWDDKELLRNTADAIVLNASSVSRTDVLGIDAEEEFREGRVLTATHYRRERNGRAPREKKRQVLSTTGCLACEACGFDYFETYGEVGRGFAECHHNRPVSELEPSTATHLSDLSILCANCHRIIHRKRPWLAVELLRQQLV